LLARFGAEATVELRDDGTASVACATQDIGTGTYTILAQQLLKNRLPLDKVKLNWVTHHFLEGPLSGGSMVTSSVVQLSLSS